jgi:hypothetical protein
MGLFPAPVMGGLDEGPTIAGLVGWRERMPPGRIGLFTGSAATRPDLLVDPGTGC